MCSFLCTQIGRKKKAKWILWKSLANENTSNAFVHAHIRIMLMLSVRCPLMLFIVRNASSISNDFELNSQGSGIRDIGMRNRPSGVWIQWAFGDIAVVRNGTRRNSVCVRPDFGHFGGNAQCTQHIIAFIADAQSLRRALAYFYAAPTNGI